MLICLFVITFHEIVWFIVDWCHSMICYNNNNNEKKNYISFTQRTPLANLRSPKPNLSWFILQCLFWPLFATLLSLVLLSSEHELYSPRFWAVPKVLTAWPVPGLSIQLLVHSWFPPILTYCRPNWLFESCLDIVSLWCRHRPAVQAVHVLLLQYTY